MHFDFHRIDAWPTLAWLATLAQGREPVVIEHGPGVETRREWFGEIVWDGDYASADFDRTDIVFGSGGRFRDDGASLVFVPAGSTVDRLAWTDAGGVVRVSNSLPALMQRLGASFDPTDSGYHDRIGTIRAGIYKYEPRLETTAGTVNLHYFHNLRWDGSRLNVLEKPLTIDGFSTFEAYRDFITQGLTGVGRNLAASERTFPLRYLAAISSGYDSPAAAALAQAGGLKEAITITSARYGNPDSGAPVGRALGLEVTELEREGWRQGHLPEVPFICSDAKGEDTPLHTAGSLLMGRVLVTGYQGGRLWHRRRKPPGPYLQRGDRSGLSLTEYRLRAGFIHCPAAFIGARRAADINRISHQAEMHAWDMESGYTKPIPRRIVEAAGAPRMSFGIGNSAVGVLFEETAGQESDSAREDFGRWLHRHRGAFVRSGKVPPQTRAWFRRLLGRPPEPMLRWMFPWAIERAKAAYVARPTGQPPQG